MLDSQHESLLQPICATKPFTVVMALMVISLTKALYRDSLREKHAAQPAE